VEAELGSEAEGGRMRPYTFFAMVVVTIAALVAMFQVALVQDVISSTGYSTSEVFSGLVAILVIFYAVILVFFVR
jgi:hypothetical protein